MELGSLHRLVLPFLPFEVDLKIVFFLNICKNQSEYIDIAHVPNKDFISVYVEESTF